MPKQRRGRSVSLERCMASPLHCSSSRSRHPFAENGLENEDNVREWEEARCPVCMEHPHNAILLLCSSHDKGCRPFMCDTSYRHSNCFDQFKKSFPKDSETTEQVTISATILNTSGGRNEEGSLSMNPVLSEDEEKPKLVCPLCRGEINGWIIVDSARSFMDAKARSCACETCEFSGTYSDLRTHARTVHPSVRPTEADPERQRNWNRLERRRDLGDLLSSMQSPLVGENTEETPEFDEGNWLTVFFLVRVFRAGSNSTSSDQSVFLRTRPTPTTRRRSIRLLMESTSEEVQSRDIGELPESSTRSNGRSNNSSGTSVVNLGRRPRRQREESSDGEAHYSSSDGGPEPRRMFTRSMIRQRRRRSPEN